MFTVSDVTDDHFLFTFTSQGEYHHSYYGNKHSPTFSSVLNHMNLKKNNSFPQSKEEIIGRKDYLCVPGSMVSSLPHQPSPLADDCCCTSCCSCDFLYCDSPTCSKDDLSSMHSKEVTVRTLLISLVSIQANILLLKLIFYF